MQQIPRAMGGSNSYVKILSGALILFLLGFVTVAVAEPSPQTKSALKSAVLLYVDNKTKGDKYLLVDRNKGHLLELRFREMHPVMFQVKKGLFAVCADFVDSAGALVSVDYYVSNISNRYQVVAEMVGRRSLLDQVKERFNLNWQRSK